MSTIIHFDIAAEDLDRAKSFYERLFNWTFSRFPGPQEYFLIDTHDEKGEMALGGGMAKRENPDQHITNFIQVDSIDHSMARVRELGGQTLGPKTRIPTVGYIAGCKDTEGNNFGLIELEKKSDESS